VVSPHLRDGRWPSLQEIRPFSPVVYIRAWTRGYLFYTVGYNSILHCHVAQIVPATAIRD
jgi:hypothetical protein